MGGIVIRREAGNHGRLEPLELIKLFEDGAIAWPELEDIDIDDRAQSDQLVKGIALGQLVWFIAQLLGRLRNGLAVTTLELFALSNVLCTVITYLAWWHKPNGVRAPIIIDGVYPPETTAWRMFEIGSNVSSGKSKGTIASVFVGIGFGALHLVGWDFHFPSEIERLLWRISSVGVTVTSVFLPALAFQEFLVEAEDKSKNTWLRYFAQKIMPSTRLGGLLVSVTFVVYGIFRLYMFVEMFVGFRNTHLSVYTTVQWTQYLPSLG